MRRFTALLCLFFLLQIKCQNPIEEQQAWSDYKTRYGKSYPNVVSEFNARGAFIGNYRAVKAQNARYRNKQSTWQADVNKFSDLTPSQYRARKLGMRPPPGFSSRAKSDPIPSVRLSPPLYWDVRTQGPGMVGPVKDQLNCGACWAYATVAALENYRSIRNKSLATLSEQELVECNYYNGCYGCDGGWFDCAFAYVKDQNGLATSKDYPATSYQDACLVGLSVVENQYPQKLVYLPFDIPTIQNWIVKNGTCAVCVDATNLGIYSSGIFNSGKSTDCNHGVAIMGYGPGYLLLRNSWSSSWGEYGYYRANLTTGGVVPGTVACFTP